MNINVRPAAAAKWADDNFAGARMRHRENEWLYARKFQNEITRHQLHQDLLVRPLRCGRTYRLTASTSLRLASPDVAVSLGVN